VSTRLTEQIRAYFDDADRQQGSVDIASVRRGVQDTTIVLDDPLHDEGPPRTSTDRRWPIIVMVAAAVSLIVVSALLLAARDDGAERQIPADPPPPTGELLVSVWSHPFADVKAGNVHVKVYADGRVLQVREPAQGWFERRLTPEGVERLLAEIRASGLFDPDHPVPEPGRYPGYLPRTTRGMIEVLTGDSPVAVDCCWGPNLDWLTEFERLLERLREPESWLPPSAWAEEQSKPYVVSSYEVCLSYEDLAQLPIQPSHVVGVLPQRAQDALGGAAHRTEVALDAKQGDAPQRRSVVDCVDLDPGDAHTFTAALDEFTAVLDDAVIESVGHPFFYRFEADFVIGTVGIRIWPYLPHGEADCGCSG